MKGTQPVKYSTGTTLNHSNNFYTVLILTAYSNVPSHLKCICMLNGKTVRQTKQAEN